MLTRKAIVLLSSVLAGALVVGGAFATYAVTDNADPYGINITKGDLEEDETDYVTLEWGSSFSLNGVGNLLTGENRKAGIVSLKATPSYEGVFSVLLEDKSTNKLAEDPHLLDYLNIYVYKNNVNLDEEGQIPEAAVLAGSILKSTAKEEDGSKKLSFNALGVPAGTEYTIIVNLDSSAVSVYSEFDEDVVRLTVDWGAKAGHEAANLVYFTLPEGWDNTLHAYAFNGSVINAAWPGVAMTRSFGSVYQVSVPEDCMKTVVFNDNNGHQTSDISFEGYAAATPYWDGDSWEAQPVSVEYSAKVNGEAISLINVVGDDTNNKAVFKVDLLEGDEIAFKAGETELQFYEGDEAVGTAFEATVAGKHTFYVNLQDRVYVVAPQPEPVEVTYYLVGMGDKWGIDDGVELTKVSDYHYRAEHVSLTKDDNIKFTDGGEGWYGVDHIYDNCGWTVGAGGNAVVSETGIYTVNFWLNSSDGNYVGLVSEQI